MQRVQRCASTPIVGTGLLVLVLSGCEAEPRTLAPIENRIPLEAAFVPTGSMQLLLFPTRHEINDPDSLRIIVVLANGGADSTVYAHPDQFEFSVEGPDGEHRFVELAGTTTAGEGHRVYLETGSFFGRMVTLGCAGCSHPFRVHAEGDYRISAAYSPPPEPLDEGEVEALPIQSTRLESDTVVVRFRRASRPPAP
jgi:hypothetical protein